MHHVTGKDICATIGLLLFMVAAMNIGFISAVSRAVTEWVAAW